MLSTENTVLIIVDVQGKLAQAMYARENLFGNLQKIIRGAQIIGIPILCTEQNPDGLGPTIPEIAPLLTRVDPIAKFSFSCWACRPFQQRLAALSRKNVLIAGIETHICVYQTAVDLLKAGYAVHIIADAVSSRSVENRQIGLEKGRAAGAAVTSTETVLFELLKTAEDRRFKDILNLVK